LNESIAFGFIGLGGGLLVAMLVAWIRAKQAGSQADQARSGAARIVEEAKKDAAAIKKEAEIHAKDSVLKERGEFEKEVRETRRELQNQEKRLIGKEEGIDKRIESVDKREADFVRREQSIKSREKNLEDKAADMERQVDEARRQLEQVAGMTREEAKKNLIDQMVEEAKHESAKRIRVIEEEAKEEAVRRGQKIVALAIERLAGDFVAERSVTVFPLPNDELKGKIIGREGRNIRALEAATGIDLIVDDTPETVVISGHNPIRREVARLSLEKLVSDGRIHPGRIEEVVRKSEAELEESIREAGQKAIFDVGVPGVHPEIIKLLGRL
jgi:ribonuclease Y